MITMDHWVKNYSEMLTDTEKNIKIQKQKQQYKIEYVRQQYKK